MSRKDFHHLVQEALDQVPPDFLPYLENVEIVVENWAPVSLLDEMGVPEDEELYGLYQGTPLTERSHEYAQLPDRIVLYRCPLEEDFPDPEALRREITITVLHELAHHFGIEEERLKALGWD